MQHPVQTMPPAQTAAAAPVTQPAAEPTLPVPSEPMQASQPVQMQVQPEPVVEAVQP